MEIVESKVESNKKQMNESLTAPTLSVENSGNSNVTSSSNSVKCVAAAVASTAETRTKDNTTTTAVTVANTNSTDSIAIEDMDIKMQEKPTKSTATAEFAKADELKCQQHSAKLTSANTAATTVIQIDDDIPIISLSDGEDAMGQHTPSAIQKASRKRNSAGASTIDDEQKFRLKRRKIKVAGAPKMPLTGYVRYMNDRREILRKELPTKTAIEHTKIIGEEWQKLGEDKKAPYKKAAELDKQRYLAELDTFLKERPDVLACELAKDKQKSKSPGEAGKPVLKEKSQSIGNIKSPNKEPNATTAVSKDKTRHSSEKDNSPTPAATTVDNKSRRKRTPTPPKTGGKHSSNSNNNTAYANTNNNNSNNHNSTSSSNHNSNSTTTATTSANSAASLLAATAATPGEIPIFTNEFLEHNKVFDMELRTLRKSKTDVEQQNAVLEKHVENMKFGVEKMTNENDELAEKNRLLELYLDKFKAKLAHALSSLSIPTQPNGATMDNIEKYMADLYKMATTNTHGPASLNKAKDIIRKLDLQINL
ncbi:high mobility group protein 20A [Anastrepha obliqua]|uniref:high mobility group protein 20A n=1 Tax=Anastrepha obliqua TaxID=95512 RepID=UPI00240A650D|nr:high mobility group protein 20A [Anastrepha obliqua]